MNSPPVPPENAAPNPMLQGMDLGGLFSIGMSDEAAALDPATWRLPSIESIANSIVGYRITQLLGRGGMGAVYAAQQLSLERVVAIKILPREASLDEAFVQRFHREARTLGKLQHAGIVAVYDFGTTPDGYLFIVMEYVDGTTLHDLIHGGHLQVTEALEIVKQICDALAYAHEEGIIHRDIKPTNILLDKKGRVKVADFGLAKIAAGSDTSTPAVTPPPSIARTRTGVGLGTPDYAAPEQMRGYSNVDHRADIYSLGVMFYEMLTGSVPRGYFDPPSKRRGTDARLDSVVLRAMHEQPEQRYQQAGTMRDDVTRVQSSVGLDPQPWQRPKDSGRTLGWIVASIACVAIGAWWWIQKAPRAVVNVSTEIPIISSNEPSTKPLVTIPPEKIKPKVSQTKAGSDAKPIGVKPAPSMPTPIRPEANMLVTPDTKAPVESTTAVPIASKNQATELPMKATVGTLTFQHHRYALVTEAMPWSKAQAYAKAQGARLATASSSEATAWLAANVLAKQPGLIFLGGQCWMPGGAWEWDSGIEWSHTEWSGATPFYGALALDAEGKWQALNFDEARPFIIEWPSD